MARDIDIGEVRMGSMEDIVALLSFILGQDLDNSQEEV